jgi:hypothetical protein
MASSGGATAEVLLSIKESIEQLNFFVHDKRFWDDIWERLMVRQTRQESSRW